MAGTSSEPVVIVGAGLIGLSIAYELARRGESVRVFDVAEPAQGASWAGAGMLAPYTEAGVSSAFDAFCAESLERYPSFVEGVRACGGVDARLHLEGILEVAFEAAGWARLRARGEALRARGIGARELDRTGLRAFEPAIGGRALGAILCEPEGHVDNRRLGRALLAACRALGVRIEPGARGVALESDGRRMLGLRAPDGFVPARAVVNACGAWAAELGGVPEHARVPVRPVKGQMLALAMPRHLVRHVVWVPGAYLVPRDDGRLLVGATVEDEGFDVRVTAGGVRALLDAALAALPIVGGLSLAETWAGLRPGSPDGLPFIGATAVAGYFVAAGHYRNGILLAPATAALIARVLAGEPGIPAFSPQRDHGAAPVAAKPPA